MGFIQGVNEPCMFRHPSTGLIVVLYVDDLITRGSADSTDAFHVALAQRFECTPEEYLTADHDLEFLGFTISKEEDEKDVRLYMDQSEATQELLNGFSRESLPYKSCPMPSKLLFGSDVTACTANAAAIYMHTVGVLSFLARTVRYDIAFAVSRLSRKMACPDLGAWKAMLYLLGYLRATVDFRIGGSISGIVDAFHFYVDSDHAADRELNSRSQSGLLIFLNSFPVDWVSRRQPVTAVSPAEAEIYAMREGVLHGRLAQWVAEEMGLSVAWPFVLQSDSKQAISFQKATAPKSKLRGCIDLREQSVVELRDQGIVSSKFIPRDLNLSDMLTHCLSMPKFRQNLSRAQNFRSYSCRGACVLTYSHSVQLLSYNVKL
jgi:hypothetical protein